MKGRPWTAADDDYLRAHHTEQTQQQMGDALGRQQSVIRRHLIMLGLHQAHAWWSETEEANLRTWYGKQKTAWIAAQLGRTVHAVNSHAQELGLRPEDTRGRLPWTQEEDEQLKQLYPTQTYAAIAQALGRSEAAIKNRAKILRLRRKQRAPQVTVCASRNRLPWSPTEDAQLIALFQQYTVRAVAAQLHRSVYAVQQRLYLLQTRRTAGYKGPIQKAPPPTTQPATPAPEDRPADEYRPNNDIPLPIPCRTCRWREAESGAARRNWNRYNTLCAYILRTGEPRSGHPVGDHCPEYEARKEETAD